MSIKKALLWRSKNETDIEKQGVIWNMLATILNSTVSILLLLIVTRVVGVTLAGIFSLGYSTSQMLLTIGNYGMRNFQVTDIREKYSTEIYLASRIITCSIMISMGLIIVLISRYDFQKALITILLCLLKLTEALEDVYGGYFQKNNRLDISGKCLFFRSVSYIIAFILTLALSKNLILSCILMLITSALVLYLLISSTTCVLKFEKPKFEYAKIFTLLKECLPLCISSFLLIYLGNAPKYFIDYYLSDTAQAYYTYLFMPCFVTNLFVSFALQPLLVRLSKTWYKKDHHNFIKLFAQMLLVAMAINAGIITVGYFFGCPILSLIFGVDLNKYRFVLTILLLGGGFFSFAVICQIIMTILRKQTFFILTFGFASIVVTILSALLIQSKALHGAALSYTLSSGILFLTLLLLSIYFIYKDWLSQKENKNEKK